MITPPAFPALPGQGWSVRKTPTFATRVAGHVSGREVRGALYAAPLWQFELTYEGLAATAAFPGLGAGSFQSLLGLYLRCQGQFGTFLYTDPRDTLVIGGAIATGDGASASFVIPRVLGGFVEPVGWITALTAVYVNGAPASGWALAAPNILTLSSAPSAGAVVTGDFRFAYLCRFLDDAQTFEEFMAGLWRVESLKFRSVRS